jgi:LacI family transcriptional regulator
MLWLAEPEYERRMIRQIVSNSLVDGVIATSTLIDDPIISSLHDSRMPFILIGRHPALNINSLDVDNVEGARLATAHLLEHGRKLVATIMGPQNMFPGHDRNHGYCLALQEKGMLKDAALTAEGDFTEAGGYVAMQKLLPCHPDAVFAASDTMASGALRAIREAGLRVPEDIAVVGYDDMPIAAQMVPPLTTIRQPIQRMGALAVETLIEIIHNPGGEPRHIVLQPELIIRESCGRKLEDTTR